MAIEMNRVDAIINKHGGEPRALIPMLLDIQSELSYLPREAWQRVAQKTMLPQIRVLQVIHFFKTFSLRPRGQHLISVCTGTACYVGDGLSIAEQIGRLLRIQPGETTRDGQFTLEMTNCPGSCPVGPVMAVDGAVYSRVTANRAAQILQQFMSAKESNADDNAKINR